MDHIRRPLQVSRRSVLRGALVGAGLISCWSLYALVVSADEAKEAPGKDGAIDNALGLDAEAVRQVYEKLQKALLEHDKRAISSLVRYPLVARGNDGSVVVLYTKRDVRNNYQQVFSRRVRKKILEQRFDELFVNASGVMFGDGELWISRICRDDKECKDADYLITAVNF